MFQVSDLLNCIVIPFDCDRYIHEKREETYQKAIQELENHRIDHAKDLFLLSYNNGNCLAGLKYAITSLVCCGANLDAMHSILQQCSCSGYPQAIFVLIHGWFSNTGTKYVDGQLKSLYYRCFPSMIEMGNMEDVHACYYLGCAHFDYEHAEYDKVKMLEKSFQKGFDPAGLSLARMLLYDSQNNMKSRSGLQNVNRAIKIVRSLEDKDSEARFELGKMYYYGMFFAKDEEKGHSYIESAASSGSTNAQEFLGDLFNRGLLTDNNYEQARKWYKKSADNGNCSALVKLGEIYETCLEDKFTAYDYYVKASQKGSILADYRLSTLMLSDEEYKDLENGMALLEKTAEIGIPEAQLSFAQFLRGREDFKASFDLFEKSFNNGIMEAAHYIGEYYYKGLGIAPDKTAAMQWYRTAYSNGILRSGIPLAEILFALNQQNEGIAILEEIHERTKGQEAKLRKEDHRYLADLCMNNSDGFEGRRIAYHHYCVAFLSGDKESFYHVGEMFFQGYNDEAYQVSPGTVLSEIRSRIFEDDGKKYAYLLGSIYTWGRYFPIDEKEAQKWFDYAESMNS